MFLYETAEYSTNRYCQYSCPPLGGGSVVIDEYGYTTQPRKSGVFYLKGGEMYMFVHEGDGPGETSQGVDGVEENKGVFIVGDSEETKEMLVSEALDVEMENPGRVGTAETMGVP